MRSTKPTLPNKDNIMRYGKYVVMHENKLFTCNSEAKKLAAKYWGLSYDKRDRMIIAVPQVVMMPPRHHERPSS